MNCPNCGNELQNGKIFCTGCGTKVGTGPSAAGLAADSNPLPPKVQTYPSQNSPVIDIEGHVVPIAKKNAANPPSNFSMIKYTDQTLPKIVSPSSLPLPPRLAANTHLEANMQLPRQSGVTPDAGYVLFEPQKEGSESLFKNKWVIFTSLMVFILIGGIPLVQYLSKLVGGNNIKEPIVNDTYNYSVTFPAGWKSFKDPEARAGMADAIGYYIKGSSAKPIVTSVFYHVNTAGDFPKYFNDRELDQLEATFKMMNESYMQHMGYKYEFIDFKTYPLSDGSDCPWMEGNGNKGKNEPIRDQTFAVFNNKGVIIIKFLFEEKNLNDVWPDIDFIMSSIVPAKV